MLRLITTLSHKNGYIGLISKVSLPFPKTHGCRFLSYKVPQVPVITESDRLPLPSPTKIDQKTIELLERLSLVDFGNKEGIARLEAAVLLADQICTIDTTDIEPLVSVLEDSVLIQRPDVLNDGNCRKDILANAAVLEEEFFVAPPGNIPLLPKPNLLEKD